MSVEADGQGTATDEAGYPRHWEADVVLRDGSVAHLRPIRPSDADGLRTFHEGQSEQSIYFRFFAPLRQLSDRDVHRFTHVDHRQRVALVATVRGAIVGIGRYDRLEDDGPVAEVAFNISDRFQGRGVGSVLLEHLAAIGQESGVQQFVADVLPANRKMMKVFIDAGYEVGHEFDDGVIAVSFDIEPTEQSRAVRTSREQRAEAVSVRRVLHPSSVAVVGVRRSEESTGGTVLANILAGGFTGAVHVVHPEAEEIQGIRCVPTLRDIDGDVDLAVIAVPAESVLDVVDDCAAVGVRAMLVVSAGFAEAGDEGAARQQELVRKAHAAGMRVIGPNSFGVVNTDPQIKLNASLGPVTPPQGGLGLFAQSGALGVAVLAWARDLGLGLSTFASAGNRVDVSGNDLMQYWVEDDATSVVGLYLESMGNPRKFSRVARRLALTKPVIVVKSGVSTFGVPPGHRVRSTQARPEVFDAMLRQAGVIRVESLHQLFDVAQLLVHQQLPEGPRVAVVGNSDALGALAADAALSWGLEVSDAPVTLPAEASAQEFAAAIRAACQDEDVDAVVCCAIPPLHEIDEEFAAAINQVARETPKTVVATMPGMRGVGEKLRADEETVPLYPLPEDAVRALAAAVRYAQWRAREHGAFVRRDDVDRRSAHNLVETVLQGSPEGRPLTAQEIADLLEAYGIPVWRTQPVENADAAVAAAEEIGYPVVVKSVSPLVRHQQGLSAIRTGLRDEPSVRGAFADLTESLAPLHADRLAVQKMSSGVPCRVSSTEDPLFGPVVNFGLSGMPSDLLDDVSHRIPPMTEVDVRDLLTSVKASPLLDGRPGTPPADREALEDLLARISLLADDLPEMASLVLDPVMATEHGVTVLGAEASVAPAPVRTDSGRRALPGSG